MLVLISVSGGNAGAESTPRACQDEKSHEDRVSCLLELGQRCLAGKDDRCLPEAIQACREAEAKAPTEMLRGRAKRCREEAERRDAQHGKGQEKPPKAGRSNEKKDPPERLPQTVVIPPPPPPPPIPAPAPRPWLHISSNPQGAEVWIDGVRQPDRTPTSVEVQEGTHRVELRLQAHAPIARDVPVPARGVRIEIPLKSQMSTLHLRPADESAEGATVYKGETELGHLPLSYRIRRGERVLLQIYKPGYQRLTLTDVILYDQEQELSVSLMPVAVGTLSPRPELPRTELPPPVKPRTELPPPVKPRTELPSPDKPPHLPVHVEFQVTPPLPPIRPGRRELTIGISALSGGFAWMIAGAILASSASSSSYSSSASTRNSSSLYGGLALASALLIVPHALFGSIYLARGLELRQRAQLPTTVLAPVPGGAQGSLTWHF